MSDKWRLPRRVARPGRTRGAPASPAHASLAVALLSLVAVAIMACDSSGDNGSGRHVTVNSYQVSDRVTTLVLNSGSGTVDLSTGSGPVSVQETLSYSGSSPLTSHRVQDGTLTLEHGGCPGSGIKVCGVSYRVQVPAATSARITTDNGTVSVRGLSAPLSVTSGAGTIQASDLRSPSVDVRSSAGSVTLRFTAAPDDVRAHTNVGSVGVYLPGGVSYNVDAHTAVGRSHVSVTQQPDSPHRITADSEVGQVTVAPT